jgi:O-antigen/teichoic acid export membrane protein
LSHHALPPVAAPAPSPWARLIRNSNWNFAAFAVAVLANFLTLPIVVHRIGIAQFGAGGLVIALLAPLMLVGTVIAQACVRELAPMFSEQRHDEARAMFSTALALCLAGCLLVFLVFGVGGSLFGARLVDTPVIARSALPLVCLTAAAGWVAQQLFAVFQAAIAATQRYRLLALLNVASALGAAACLVAATWLEPTVFGFLLGTALGYGITLGFSALQARRCAPALFPLARPRRVALGRLLDFGRWQGTSQLAGALALQADRYLLGATAALSMVGALNVATRLQEVVYMGVLKISEVLFPHFSVSAGKPLEEQAPLYLTSTWLINAIAAAALAPLIPLADAVVTLWVGPEAAVAGGPILRTLATAGIVGSGVNVFSYYALGHGHTRYVAQMSLVHCVVVAAASTALILLLGPLAAGAGFLVANVVRLAWVTADTPRLTGRTMGVLDAALTTLPPLAAGVLVGWAPWPAAASRAGSWAAVAAAYALIALAVILVAVALSTLGAHPRRLLVRVRDGMRTHFLKR